ncbi:sugar ABC transporter substrate-binding protein [Nocardioides immobilis]|uniref:Sugar ABC transporter substrate-binding protein n=1 Tax=Nocardioides immobilis TaxID=2049295 RepID=A0A417Y6T3_9ACTN|nr:sugar ABC transporter substrate-binding protein [Nocardioides immobilis]RHW28359.1 sugar ABC transporter substrate-binding protein [Nocardioides immobilis]
MKTIKLSALVVAGVLGLAACASPEDDNGSSGGGGADRSDVTIAMVTHGDGGSFWSVAKTGAEDAAADMGVELDYQESNNDPQKQAQLIEAAITSDIDGLAVSVPNPDAIEDALAKARDAGIPIVTLNSGATVWQDLGAITHVGQDERIAGEGAGRELAAAGGTKLLCVIHEQNNVGLQDRCAGAEDAFGGEVEDFQVTGTADPTKTANEIAAKLQADPSIDSVLALNPDIATAAVEALSTAGSDANLATFDLSGDVVTAVEDGDILFAVDQQQYLQGYLPVAFLTLYNTNANTVGGGQPILTGPGFVTQDNASTVADLAQEGTR